MRPEENTPIDTTDSTAPAVHEVEPATMSDTVATEPVATQPEAAPPVPPELPLAKKPSKRKWVLWLVLFLLLLMVGAAAYYFLVLVPGSKKEDVAKTTATQQSTTPVEPVEKFVAESLVNDVIAELGAAAHNAKDGTSLSIKPDGYTFYIIPRTYFALSISGTQAEMDANLASIKNYVQSKGYTVTDERALGDQEKPYAALYNSSDAWCASFTNTPYPANPSAKTHEILFSCADMATAKKAAETMKPLNVAYQAAAKRSNEDISYSEPTIKDSKTTGYKWATVGTNGKVYAPVGGFIGLYYQTPDKEWHYFLGTQQMVLCSSYKTPDERKAFLGEQCYDTKTDKTIKVSL